MQFQPNPTQKRRGITLIELLAVVMILGSLMAIATPMLFNLREYFARDRNAYTARTLASAVARFHLEGHSFTNLVADADNNVAVEDIVAQLYAAGLLQHTNIYSHQILVKFVPTSNPQYTTGFPADVDGVLLDGVLYFFPTKDP